MSIKAAGISVEWIDEARMEQLGVRSWPLWTCEASVFPWTYDETETCYLLAGDVEIDTPEGKVEIGMGDLVTFPKGLTCTWRAHTAVRKHYKHG